LWKALCHSPRPDAGPGTVRGPCPRSSAQLVNHYYCKRIMKCSIRRTTRLYLKRVARPCLKCSCRERIPLHLQPRGNCPLVKLSHCLGRSVARPTHRSRADGGGRRHPMLGIWQALEKHLTCSIITKESPFAESWCYEVQADLMGLEASLGPPCADNPTLCIELLLQ
jgi:hypothetical protein